MKHLSPYQIQRTLYYPGCEETIPDPVCSDCPTKELGGVRSFWLQKDTFAFADITDTAEWTAAINNKDVYVFPKSRGSVEPTETESPGFGDQATVIDGYDFVASFFEPNAIPNIAFWNAMKRANNYKLGYRTESKVFLTDDAVGIIPKFPIGEDLKVAIVTNVTFKFSQEDSPLAFDMPENVFTQCIAVS